MRFVLLLLTFFCETEYSASSGQFWPYYPTWDCAEIASKSSFSDSDKKRSTDAAHKSNNTNPLIKQKWIQVTSGAGKRKTWFQTKISSRDIEKLQEQFLYKIESEKLGTLKMSEFQTYSSSKSDEQKLW